MPDRKRRGASAWCEEHGVGVGDSLEIRLAGEWVPVTVTALGTSAILARRKGCGEFAHGEPALMRLRDGFVPRSERVAAGLYPVLRCRNCRASHRAERPCFSLTSASPDHLFADWAANFRPAPHRCSPEFVGMADLVGFEVVP